MRNEFPQKQRTSSVLPQHFVLYLINGNSSDNTIHNGTQYYVVFFACMMTNQSAFKRYYNIAVGRTV